MLCPVAPVEDVENFDIKYQVRVGGNIGSFAFTIGEAGGNDQGALAFDFHADHALIPALDDFADANDKAEWRDTGTRGIELLAFAIWFGRVIEPTGVMNKDGAAVYY